MTCAREKKSKRDVSESGSNLFGFNLTIEAMGRKRVREEREGDSGGKTVSE